jgi:hypothetical protein
MHLNSTTEGQMEQSTKTQLTEIFRALDCLREAQALIEHLAARQMVPIAIETSRPMSFDRRMTDAPYVALVIQDSDGRPVRLFLDPKISEDRRGELDMRLGELDETLGEWRFSLPVNTRIEVGPGGTYPGEKKVHRDLRGTPAIEHGESAWGEVLGIPGPAAPTSGPTKVIKLGDISKGAR